MVNGVEKPTQHHLTKVGFNLAESEKILASEHKLLVERKIEALTQYAYDDNTGGMVPVLDLCFFDTVGREYLLSMLESIKDCV